MPANPDAKPILVRALTAPDVPAFLGLIQALADYEKLPGPNTEACERLARDALTEPPLFHVLLAELDGRVVGYGLYFFTYSTFLARPTLYVEDVFVLPEARGNGVGRTIMKALAREAARNECGRMEWQVLHWNTTAMAFYERLGAAPLDGWRPYRMTAEQFTRLAEQG